MFFVGSRSRTPFFHQFFNIIPKDTILGLKKQVGPKMAPRMNQVAPKGVNMSLSGAICGGGGGVWDRPLSRIGSDCFLFIFERCIIDLGSLFFQLGQIG